MDRRGRIAALLAGAVGLAAAVVFLRESQDSAPRQPDAPPPTIAIAPTTVSEMAAAGVVLPEPGDPPDTVGEVRATPGDRTLRLSWADAVTGSKPRGAAGYDVRWGLPGALDNTMLVAAPEVELRGLTNDERYDVEVRSVDAFGRRSEPITGSGTPGTPLTPEADPRRVELTGLYDDFRADDAPNPKLWAVQRPGRSCLRAGPGDGAEDDRLVLELRCGTSEAALRARVPLRLQPGPVFGRIVVVTDGPIPGGELSIAVVPGPVTALGVGPAPNLPKAEPGRAVEDAALPPGTIRAVISAAGATITAAPGMPRTAGPAPTGELTSVLGAPGVTARWDLQFGANGVTLRRDDELAASGDVLPNWQEATVLVGFSASPGDSARLHVDAIGFTGAPSEPPTVVDTVGVIGADTSLRPDAIGPTRKLVAAAPQAQSARIQVVAGPSPVCTEGDLYVDVHGHQLPLVPSVPGGAPPNGPFCPLVADLPAELLDRLRTGGMHTPLVRSASGASVTLTSTLSVTYPPGTEVEREPSDPPGPPPTDELHRLAHLSAEVRNAAGEELVAGDSVPRGRMVLEVSLDGLAGQRQTGELGGLAGIEIRLDGELVAGLPTTVDGPAAAGNYRFGLSTSKLAPGSHVIEVRVLGSEAGARSRTQLISIQLDG